MSETNTTQSDLPIEKIIQTYENEFNTNLAVVNRFINTKGLKQKAFMRAITAAFEVGVVPESQMHNFQTEEEATMAGILAKLMDLKFVIKMYKQQQTSTQGEVTNG